MANCTACGQSYLRCNCESQQPYCEQCNEDNKCNFEMDALCVKYHPYNDSPSQLDNLNMPNGSNLEDILEAIDDFLGNNANVPITPIDSQSIDLTSSGVAGHTIKADAIISPDSVNQLEIRPNGLYAKPYNENFLVKVNSADAPDYLKNQIVGGIDPDGIVAIDVVDNAGLLEIKPSFSVLCLLKKIKEDFPEEFCALINDICVNLGWVADDLICLLEDFETVMVNDGNDLPEPAYSFIDNNIVYFVSQANSTGKVWTIDPYTYVNNTNIVYVNETRTGQPYGPSGGTYFPALPYRGNGISPYAEPSNTYGTYYDVASRTLFIHGNKTFGCDYYDFATTTWGKVAIAGSVTSVYNTTTSTDAFTHTYMGSNSGTNLIVTGWGTNIGDRGTKVIIIDKTLRQVVQERDTIASPVAGFSSNPFNNVWSANVSSTNKIVVAKGQSTYRDVAILNADLTFNQELVLPISTIGLYGLGGLYVQGLFFDNIEDKIYLNEIGSRRVYVYSKVGISYTLTKTFLLNNNRSFVNASVNFAINPVTNELFWDVLYGDNNPVYNPDGIADALEADKISYKINRSTLEIERIYIGQLKAVQLAVFTNGDVINSFRGNHSPTVPTTDGTFSLEELSPTVVNTGVVHVGTLKEVNLNNNVPTGNTKPNVISDPDFIPDYQDIVECPITYNLNCPSNVVMTASTTQATLEFGLGVQVVNNPVLAKVRAVFDVAGVQKGMVEWTIPNTPNPNAFFATTALAGVASGNILDVSVLYVNSSNVVIGTCTDVHSITVP